MQLNRSQLDLIRAKLDAGMAPGDVAGWIARVTDRTPDQCAAILAAAETLHEGGQPADALYTAADAAMSSSETK